MEKSSGLPTGLKTCCFIEIGYGFHRGANQWLVFFHLKYFQPKSFSTENFSYIKICLVQRANQSLIIVFFLYAYMNVLYKLDIMIYSIAAHF